MSKAQELTSAHFDQTVGSGVSLIDFWAEWCGPCRMMGPILDQIAGEYLGRAAVAKVNVDNEPDLARKFNVSSIPTLIVFKDGRVHKYFVGVTSKADLAAALDQAIQAEESTQS